MHSAIIDSPQELCKNLKMLIGRQLLQNILKDIQQITHRKEQSLVVFDLDSTLFDVSPRLEKILTNFAEVPEHQTLFPESVKILKNIKAYRNDWGIKNAVLRAGLDKHDPALHTALRDFWHKNFFSNHYLQYDVPYDGAAEYVQQLHQAGAHIAYLTGRDMARMGAGSAEVLLKWDFPLNEQDALLVLKPEKGMNDAAFKSDWFAAIPENKYKKIWFFENEPVNVNLVRNVHQHVDIVFFESTHSGKETAPDDLPKILDYLLKD